MLTFSNVTQRFRFASPPSNVAGKDFKLISLDCFVPPWDYRNTIIITVICFGNNILAIVKIVTGLGVYLRSERLLDLSLDLPLPLLGSGDQLRPLLLPGAGDLVPLFPEPPLFPLW